MITKHLNRNSLLSAIHPDKKIDGAAIKVLKGILKESKNRCQAMYAVMRAAEINIGAMKESFAAELEIQQAIKKTLARATSSRRKGRSR